MRKFLVFTAIAISALLMAGCDLFGITGLSLDTTSATVMVNDTVQLSAVVVPASASATGLVWESDHPLVASVDAAGLVTALAPGAASISVSSASGTLSATCAVTVPPIYLISANIATSAAWTAGNTYYVTNAVHILSGATLTIQPGTTVKFHANSNANAGLIADSGSSINAAGTGSAADKAIVFTSFKDASVGTAIPGAAITPAAGDWANIAVIGTGNVFAYCVFSYASANALFIGDSWTGGARVDHCVFRDNSGAAGDPFGAALNASYDPTTIFTSIRDDSVKGDTDGPSTPAAAVGDWHGIYKENSDSAGDGYFLTGANIRFSSDIVS